MKKAGIKNYIEIVGLSVGEVEHADTDDADDKTGDDLVDNLATIHA
jgi:hypothetical protein